MSGAIRRSSATIMVSRCAVCGFTVSRNGLHTRHVLGDTTETTKTNHSDTLAQIATSQRRTATRQVERSLTGPILCVWLLALFLRIGEASLEHCVTRPHRSVSVVSQSGVHTAAMTAFAARSCADCARDSAVLIPSGLGRPTPTAGL
jgi:hypothetical protein